MTGEQINERMDFLAGSVSPTSLSIHTRHLDEGLKIWMDLLNNPAFPEDKLRREKDLALPSIRNRNKNVSQVASQDLQPAHLRRRLAYYGRDDRGGSQQHHPRRPDRVAQEVLGRQQRHPGRHGRLQEGGNAAEAGGDLREMAHGGKSGAADSQGAAGGKGRRLHGAAGGHSQPGNHPDRPPGDHARTIRTIRQST